MRITGEFWPDAKKRRFVADWNAHEMSNAALRERYGCADPAQKASELRAQGWPAERRPRSPNSGTRPVASRAAPRWPASMSWFAPGE